MDPLAALLAFGAGAGAAKAFTALREHRSEPAGLADAVGWGFLVGEGVVLQKDGSFLAGWRYRGPDLASSTAREVDLLSLHIADALRPYGDNWMFHVDAVRRPATSYAPKGAFPDAVTALIDAERRHRYAASRAYFETDHYLVCTYLPPPELYSRLARLFVKGSVDLEETNWHSTLQGFLSDVAELERRLAARLHLARLSSDGLATHLHTCLTGLHHPVRAPEHGAYLGHTLCEQPLVGGFRPRIGALALRPVALQGFPATSTSGLMEFLGTLGHGYRWSNRIIPLSHSAAAREIRRHRQGWLQKRRGAAALLRGMTGSPDAPPGRATDEELFMDGHAHSMLEDAAAAMATLSSGEARFCYYTSVLVVAEESEAKADLIAADVLEAVRARRFTARVEDVNALEAFMGTLPGHGYANLRKPVLSTTNIADLLPVTSVWPGRSENPSPFFPEGSPALLWAATAETTPFRVNLHDDDVGHTLVIGSTGSGKSVLAGTLLAQWFRYEGAQAFLFDVGYAGYLLARACGARHYDIAAGHPDKVCFQPLASVDDPAERAWAVDWLETLVSLQGTPVTPAERGRLARALELLAQSPREHRTLTELLVQVQSPQLKEALRPYTTGGPFGYLLDADADGLGEGAYQVFELKHLIELSDKVLVPVLLYLFRRLERRLSAGRPTLIVIEEAWAALMKTTFAERIRQWLLTLRKENAAVVLVAHSPAQLADLENRQLLVESCPTRIFLPNADALDAQNAALYAALGLGEAEVDLVARARRKQDYYFASPSGRRLFSLGLGPAALAFLGSRPGLSAQQTMAAADALIQEHGSAWPAYWLRQCGLPDEAAALASGLQPERTFGPDKASPSGPFSDLFSDGAAGAVSTAPVLGVRSPEVPRGEAPRPTTSPTNSW